MQEILRPDSFWDYEPINFPWFLFETFWFLLIFLKISWVLVKENHFEPRVKFSTRVQESFLEPQVAMRVGAKERLKRAMYSCLKELAVLSRLCFCAVAGLDPIAEQFPLFLNPYD